MTGRDGTSGPLFRLLAFGPPIAADETECNMTVTQLEIDTASILDNVDEAQVEFTGEVDGDEYQFAAQYDLLEALSGDRPENDAVDMFNRFADQISEAALSALSRNADQAMIVVSENDLE